MGTLNLKTASGGSVILNPTNTAVDVTITVPASNANMATDVSTLAQFNASGAAPVYACRAWVNFNGTGTVAIRASGNVSSITDNGVGDFSVNFTIALPDANYSPVFGTDAIASDSFSQPGLGVNITIPPTTSVLRTKSLGYNGTAHDVTYANISIFR